jgi:hypothetical protein
MTAKSRALLSDRRTMNLEVSRLGPFEDFLGLGDIVLCAMGD